MLSDTLNQLQKQLGPISLKRHPKSRRISISSHWNGVTITIPKRMPKYVINLYLKQQAPKLLKTVPSSIIKPGSKIAGKSLDIRQGRNSFDAKSLTFHIDGDYLDPKNQKYMQGKIKDYLIKQSSSLTPLVDKWSKTMDLKYKDLKYKMLKSRWGSCDKNQGLVFNALLLNLDSDLQNYVIVHELAHIRHMNHSKDFWEEVAKYIPEYKGLRKRLNKQSVNW